jgi:hypothetical protein
MKISKRIEPLVEDGLVDAATCQLMSGKEIELTGCFERSTVPVDLGSVILEIDDARAEEAARQLRFERSTGPQ